ncbi:precorrin-3B synthase [Pandoraea faecigallinarum]|uniref:precorrin-3B synthase n=1 Tax=Pandoraea faecigallinarum TaxID=656179 RepID=UPI000A456C02|nr:precorrin-3B synthase [Pandoraea faecigallinarum]
MTSRDGGLCRVKLPGGKLSAAQALAIAHAAETFASGVLELTNRSNLQLRGVHDDAQAHLTRQLIDAGLGPRVQHDRNALHDPAGTSCIAHRTAVADDVRNLMLSPAAGVDAGALFDTTALADTLLIRLENEPRFAALSPKVSVLLDGGERLAALDHPHDVWLSPMSPGTGREPMFVFGLAGAPGMTFAQALGAVRACDVPALVHALLCNFIDLADAGDKRMRDLLRTHRANDVANRAAAHAGVTLHRNAAVDAWRRTPADPLRRFGAWPQRNAGLWHVGAQAPLGRLDAATLRALADLARSYSPGGIRVTPWQGVMLTDVAHCDVAAVEQAFDRLNLIRSAQTPLGRLIACAGSTGCAKALSDTKADARDLAGRLNESVEVHLSGCVRSCAAAHRAPWTLVAVAPGRYDLYRHPAASLAIAGTAEPAGRRQADAGRFGERIATDMPLEAIALRLNSQDRIAQP